MPMKSPRNIARFLATTAPNVTAGYDGSLPPRGSVGLPESDFSTRELHKRLDTHCTLEPMQVRQSEKPALSTGFAEPLTDSNRRPPSYHGGFDRGFWMPE